MWALVAHKTQIQTMEVNSSKSFNLAIKTKMLLQLLQPITAF